MRWESFIGKIPELTHYVPDRKKGSEQGKILPYRDELLRRFPDIKYRPAAVLILFYPDLSGNVHTVLIERNWYDGVHSGQIAFPGGKAEPHDKNLQQTALRETEEELGVPAKNMEIICPLNRVKIPVSGFEVTPFLAYTEKRPSFVPDPAEVRNILEVPVDYLLQTPWQVEERLFEEKFYTVYFLPLKNYKIWGATAMVIAELRDIFKHHADF